MRCGWRWLAVDVIWGTAGGLGIGFVIGVGVARGVRALRSWRRDAAIFDEFLLLGVIALSYGVGAGGARAGIPRGVRRGARAATRRRHSRQFAPQADKPPLTPSMLNVNEQLERIVEVAVVLLVGAMISTGYWSMAGLGCSRRCCSS